ncbi:MAG: hypothetical protein EBX37_09960 [Alphaproteobacteria bacterium]|nr:hypothetical protein [Alphaproteobacteria bacterium]
MTTRFLYRHSTFYNSELACCLIFFIQYRVFANHTLLFFCLFLIFYIRYKLLRLGNIIFPFPVFHTSFIDCKLFFPSRFYTLSIG